MRLLQDPKSNARLRSGATATEAQVTGTVVPMDQIGPSALPPKRATLSGGVAIFLTGLPGAGKTTIARELGNRCTVLGYRVTMLDGDDLRARVSPDLGFSPSDREVNLRRAALIASEVVKHGGIALCSFIAPYGKSRRETRDTIEEHGQFFLVHVSTPIEECERRDPKGLYRRARAGTLASFTGISDVYETPTDSDVSIDTTGLSVVESATRVARGLATMRSPSFFWLAAALHLRTSSVANGFDEGEAPPSIHTPRQPSLFESILGATSKLRVTLDEVAREVGTERHTIEKAVRSITGQSFRDLHHRLLLERANLLLAQGKPIKEVSFELGFGSPQSFHRFIRKVTGKTPSLLRQSA